MRGFYGGLHFNNNQLNKDALKTPLRKNLKRLIDESSTFDARCLVIHHKIIDGLEENTRHIIIDAEANKLVHDYILKYPQEFLKSGLIVPSGELLSLEPFIDQYLTWPKFEQILFTTHDDLPILELKTFYYRYRANGYKPVSRTHYQEINVVSDSLTEFVASRHFPDLMSGPSIERKNNKLTYSAPFPQLIDAKWIAHSSQIPFEQQVKGGEYLFKKKFSLDGLDSRIKTAKIYFLVDDSVSIQVNGEQLRGEYSGFVELHEIDLAKYIQIGQNEILFHVRNIPYDREKLNANPEANPYEFIYNIIIELEN